MSSAARFIRHRGKQERLITKTNNEKTNAMKIENYEMNDETGTAGHQTRENCRNHARARIPLTTLPGRSLAGRAYLRGLRAAEMAAWESTGGDYLLSR